MTTQMTDANGKPLATAKVTDATLASAVPESVYSIIDDQTAGDKAVVAYAAAAAAAAPNSPAAIQAANATTVTAAALAQNTTAVQAGQLGQRGLGSMLDFRKTLHGKNDRQPNADNSKK